MKSTFISPSLSRLVIDVACLSKSKIESSIDSSIISVGIKTRFFNGRVKPCFAQALLKKRKARVVACLGGMDSPAYADKVFAQSVFRQAEVDFKDHFNINRYDMLPKKFADAALSYWMTWEPSTNTKMKILEMNAYEL